MSQFGVIFRIRFTLFQLLIGVDQLMYVLIFGLLYVVGVSTIRPSADETISSRVGRYAIKGRSWALLLEAVINTIFLLLVQQDDHCRKAVEWDEGYYVKFY